MDYIRQLELFDNSTFKKQIHIIGCGAIGSWVAISLAKLGLAPQITLYDFDKVEAHNLPNQAFSVSDIGSLKAEALKDEIYRLTGQHVKTEGKYEEQRLSGYVFLMVDSMRERKRISKQCKFQSQINHIIDARMGLSIIRLYNINPNNLASIEKYKESLYSDESSEVSACGASTSVITSALSAASFAVRQLINVHNEELVDSEIIQEFIGNQVVNS